MLVVLIFYFVPSLSQVIIENIRIDTIGHFIIFFLLTWLITSFVKIPLSVCAAMLIFYAAASELGQLYLGFRHGELPDFVANIIGVFSFIIARWYKTLKLEP